LGRAARHLEPAGKRKRDRNLKHQGKTLARSAQSKFKVLIKSKKGGNLRPTETRPNFVRDYSDWGRGRASPWGVSGTPKRETFTIKGDIRFHLRRPASDLGEGETSTPALGKTPEKRLERKSLGTRES